MQYSYLPSWMSYLVDQSKAREAGRALFDAVYDRWSRLPQDQRPKLYVAGESLGSFGGETAFSGEADLRNRTAGTLFAGPPNFNTLFREFSDNRDAGEPGDRSRSTRTAARCASRATPTAGIPPEGQPWDGTRVLYLMHASDPIVWWSPQPDLAAEPDWIGEAPGKDVLEGMVVDAVRDVLAGHRGPAVLHRRPRRATATSTRPSTSTAGTRCCSPRESPRTSLNVLRTMAAKAP